MRMNKDTADLDLWIVTRLRINYMSRAQRVHFNARESGVLPRSLAKANGKKFHKNGNPSYQRKNTHGNYTNTTG